jgi:hypothetical protein
MSDNSAKKIRHRQPSYELRILGTRGDIADLLDFIQEEFTVCRQTAKKMVKSGTLLVYHLGRIEAEEHVKKYEAKGLLCIIVQMADERLG